MHRPTFLVFFLVIFQTVVAMGVCASPAKAAAATQVPTTAPPQSQSAPPPPSAPDAASSDPAASAPAPAPKKPKKVWTNDDVTGGIGPISVVGDGRGVKGKNAVQNPPDPAYIANVRKQLQKLQEQMADSDKEFATLKDFSEGEPVATSDREFHKSYNSQPIDQQMTNLQIKKKDLQSKIDVLLDEARKKGVEPGQLR
jgi:hypothetical protein